MKHSTPDTAAGTGIAPAVEPLSRAAARQADQAIDATRRAAADALDALQSGVDQLRSDAPGAFSRAAAQVETMARRGIERARETGLQVKDGAVRAGDRSVGYIRDEPVKSMLIAAAAGAAAAALIGWLWRSKSDPA
ncbi:MAG: hypothetical protein U1F56_08345 [Rubrivivax sp.]